MKFKSAFLSSRHLWSSPFVRWQGSLADVSSLDLAVAVTRDALSKRHFDPVHVSQIVELVHALREAGGGIGLSTGCAAGDTGAAFVLRVE